VLAMLAVAVLAASSAWAAGEPKNQSPFNRGVAKTLVAPEATGEAKAKAPFNRPAKGRSTFVPVDTTLSATSGAGPHRAAAIPGEIAGDWIERYAAAHPYGVGVQAAADTRGEPKNEAPFDRATSVSTISAGSTARVASHPLRGTSASFHWRDAGIGASLATLLLFLAAAGASHLRPRRPVGA
jgi:hypothetical protein